MVMADSQLIYRGNSWDHQQCERCTSHSIQAENPITHNTEDGRKCSALHFRCPVLVLEKTVLPVLAEISLSPPLQLSLVPCYSLVSSLPLDPSNSPVIRVQAFQGPVLAAPGLLEQRVVYDN